MPRHHDDPIHFAFIEAPESAADLLAELGLGAAAIREIVDRAGTLTPWTGQE